jgi:hypothetical protein
MEKGWQCVYSSGKTYDAELARQMLADHDITAIVINKQDSSYIFGDVELYVQEKNLLKARTLLKEFES